MPYIQPLLKYNRRICLLIKLSIINERERTSQSIENVFLARFSFWPTWNLCFRTLERVNEWTDERVRHWISFGCIWSMFMTHLLKCYDRPENGLTECSEFVARTPILRCVAITISLVLYCVWLLVLLLVRNCSFIFSNRFHCSVSLFRAIVHFSVRFYHVIYMYTVYTTSAYFCHAL